MADDESADVSYPSIDPSTYDLIVVGTGLPESIIASAASAAGKSVLHLDPNSFYGSHFSSLPLDLFTSHLNSLSSSSIEEDSTVNDGGDYIIVNLKPRRLYSDIEISSHVSPESLGPARKFNLDLSGPRVLFCADSAVDLILKSGAGHCLEFKSIDTTFIYGLDGDGKLSTVPDSRAAIFKDRSLGLTEKNQLMRFFKLVQEHFRPVSADGDRIEERGRISEEDLESPFVAFLKKQRLPPKIKSIVLYAIAMADYDQDDPDGSKHLLKTKDVVQSLALYSSSVGRFQNAMGAMIYPIYGQGELPQAFCRRAAVKGALYVMRMPVTSVLLDKENRHYKGVRLASGQDLFSHELVMDPSFMIQLPALLPPSSNLQHEYSLVSCLEGIEGKVARGVCIIRGSIKPDLSNLLVVFPPRSLCPEQVTSVRALQLGSNMAVCPSGLSVLYLSALCDDASQGKGLLGAAMTALFPLPISKNSEGGASEETEDTEGETRPTLMWNAIYIQELATGSSEAINLCPMPDGKLDYSNLLESTMKLFEKIYPQQELFPHAVTEDTEDHGDLPDDMSE
ncbi:rab escort protein 1 isoform X2 [Macadamia integrifolia]|uniref:rab escort protein 1 isoform X1 n=1 Tax=Macadamia integrifolia TaxID=60698 RepID=UPI001C4F7222|nr:rab escort protein 1 isoform X1 [Macadamia integrifolia]XP_042489943.1 rab escort protein 1 isoform X2 [Macadamia integrifolia]